MDFDFANITSATLFLHLSVATALGLLIGAERSIAGKSAGMRTYALVSLGACLLTVTSIVVTTAYLGRVNFDPMRMPAAIVAGIGFLGAGIILFRQDSLRGLTTAAGLWIAAAVGVAVGFGMYSIAIFAALLTLLIFTAVWFVEEMVKQHFGQRTNQYHKHVVDDDTDISRE